MRKRSQHQIRYCFYDDLATPLNIPHDGNNAHYTASQVARCYHCGSLHTYVPRGKRGLVVMSTNALSASFDALKGDDWKTKKVSFQQ